MKSMRLTKVIKEELRDKVLRKSSEKRKIESERLSQDIFNTIYMQITSGDIQLHSNLKVISVPITTILSHRDMEHFFIKTNTIRVLDNQYGNSCTIEMCANSKKSVPMPSKYIDCYNKGVINIGLSDVFQEKDLKVLRYMIIRYKNYISETDKIRIELKSNLKSMLSQINTSKQLIDTWPEALEYVDIEKEAGFKLNLPVVQGKDVNKLIARLAI